MTTTRLIGDSQPMKEILRTIEQLSAFNTTVLISGESGTGKELVARAIHESSPRRGKPFVAVNCGAIPENLIESELFGHKKGSFTDATRDKKGLFEEAHGGTLFLDEIGELPTHLQVKLLRALQERQISRVGDEIPLSIDVRIISATLRDLEADVELGRFRDDLFYRLNVVSVHIPPLRERPSDIPALVDFFLKKHCERMRLPTRKTNREFLDLLMSYGWRGNVRELENALERCLVLSSGEDLETECLPERILQQARAAKNPSKVETFGIIEDGNLSIKFHTKNVEIELIKRALEKTKGNRTHAAKILDISHRALLYKLKEYNLGQEGPVVP